ncbi:MAG: hypothetical protein V1647_04305 [Pseudomonadota bacterium]
MKRLSKIFILLAVGFLFAASANAQVAGIGFCDDVKTNEDVLAKTNFKTFDADPICIDLKNGRYRLVFKDNNGEYITLGVTVKVIKNEQGQLMLDIIPDKETEYYPESVEYQRVTNDRNRFNLFYRPLAPGSPWSIDSPEGFEMDEEISVDKDCNVIVKKGENTYAVKLDKVKKKFDIEGLATEIRTLYFAEMKAAKKKEQEVDSGRRKHSKKNYALLGNSGGEAPRAAVDLADNSKDLNEEVVHKKYTDYSIRIGIRHEEVKVTSIQKDDKGNERFIERIEERLIVVSVELTGDFKLGNRYTVSLTNGFIVLTRLNLLGYKNDVASTNDTQWDVVPDVDRSVFTLQDSEGKVITYKKMVGPVGREAWKEGMSGPSYY